MNRRRVLRWTPLCVVLGLVLMGASPSGCKGFSSTQSEASTDFVGQLNITGDCSWVGDPDDPNAGMSLDLGTVYVIKDGAIRYAGSDTVLARAGEHVTGTGTNMVGVGANGCLGLPGATELKVTHIEGTGG